MAFTKKDSCTYVIEKRETSSSLYCARSHHLAPMRDFHSNTPQEVARKLIEAGWKR